MKFLSFLVFFGSKHYILTISLPDPCKKITVPLIHTTTEKKSLWKKRGNFCFLHSIIPECVRPVGCNVCTCNFIFASELNSFCIDKWILWCVVKNKKEESSTHLYLFNFVYHNHFFFFAFVFWLNERTKKLLSWQRECWCWHNSFQSRFNDGATWNYSR